MFFVGFAIIIDIDIELDKFEFPQILKLMLFIEDSTEKSFKHSISI